MSRKGSSTSSEGRDLALMVYLDGSEGADGSAESDETALRSAELSSSDQAKLQGLAEVGEVLRTYLELEADSAEDRLEGLWGAIERQLAVPDGAPAPVPSESGREPRSPRGPADRSLSAHPDGLWARLVNWFDDYRGHILTGAVAAGAVAALILILRPPTERIVERQIAAPLRPTVVAPVIMRSTAPEIESLDVTGGTGTVFTIPDEDGEGGTAVIWLSPDESTIEEPI